MGAIGARLTFLFGSAVGASVEEIGNENADDAAAGDFSGHCGGCEEAMGWTREWGYARAGRSATE